MSRRITAVFALLFLAVCGPGHSDERAKRVLIINPYNVTYPGVLSVSQGAVQRLTEKSSAKLDLLTEFIDLARFPEENQERLAARYLAEKYAGMKPDVVVTAGREASSFVLKYRDAIARDVPLVLCCSTADVFTESLKLSNVTGTISTRDITQTLELAERLQPTTRHLVVIAGAAKFDREWVQIARQQIESRDRKFETRYLVGVPTEQLIRDVSKLPRDTIVVTLTYYADENGARYVSPDVIRGVAKAASAPVYSPYWTSFGYGLVGGFSVFNRQMGEELADLALAILGGKSAVALPPQASAAGAYRVDHRQLERWNLSAANLPAGTVISFQSPSLWSEHRTLILSVIAAFAALLGVTIFVLVQSARRARAERLLTDSEKRMVFAAASTNSGLWQMSAEDQPIWATDHCRKLFGLTKDGSLTLDRLLRNIHSEDREAFAKAMRATIRNRDPIDIEFRTVDRKGRIRWIAAKGEASYQSGKAAGTVNGLFIDVTSLKEMERDADLQRREVAQLMRQSVLNELSGSIAHELNQPLTAILSNAEAAQELLNAQELDHRKLGEILNDIVVEDTRAADVIGRVRQLLKKGDRKREAINIGKLISSTLALLRGEIVKRKIAVDVDCAPRLPLVLGDAVQLQQVLINLLVNAMDAMTSNPPSEREIRIRAFSESDQVRIIISDSGEGLSTEVREKLFEPFVSTKERGLGLGLSICASILKAHSGKIAIKNSADRGVTAILTLPALEAAVPAQ